MEQYEFNEIDLTKSINRAEEAWRRFVDIANRKYMNIRKTAILETTYGVQAYGTNDYSSFIFNPYTQYFQIISNLSGSKVYGFGIDKLEAHLKGVATLRVV